MTYRRWEELLPHLPHGGEASVEELRHAYRVPAEIMELALPLLDRIAPEIARPIAFRPGGEPPRFRETGAEHVLAHALEEAAALAREDGLLAVIAPAQLLAQAEGLREVEGGGSAYYGSIPLLTARRAKGLEFDHVVVVEPAGIAAEAGGLRDLYVALTRPTQTLTVVHSQPLP